MGSPNVPEEGVVFRVLDVMAVAIAAVVRHSSNNSTTDVVTIVLVAE